MEALVVVSVSTVAADTHTLFLIQLFMKWSLCFPNKNLLAHERLSTPASRQAVCIYIHRLTLAPWLDVVKCRYCMSSFLLLPSEYEWRSVSVPWKSHLITKLFVHSSRLMAFMFELITLLRIYTTWTLTRISDYFRTQRTPRQMISNTHNYYTVSFVCC